MGIRTSIVLAFRRRDKRTRFKCANPNSEISLFASFLKKRYTHPFFLGETHGVQI